MKTGRILLAILVLVCILCISACDFFTPTHTITFVDYDGSVLLELTVEDGAMPEYTLEDPTREATAQYTYVFMGWDKQIEPATEDLTYRAIYNEITNKYVVTFVDEDGTVLESSELEYGKTPVYLGVTPQKEATAEYTFGFDGWDKELAPVTGDVTYTAVYSQVKNEYLITFCDLDGNVLYETLVPYGEIPVYVGETPTLAGDAQYSYNFVGWHRELAPVDGVATYRVQFEQVVNEYTVQFVDEEGTVLQTGKLPYGAVPEYKGDYPLPEDTAQYDYSGAWDKEIVAVTGDATYTYIVTVEDRYYTVTFKNGDVVLAEKEYKYGEVPAYDLVPLKAATEEYLYTFNGWDKELAAVAGDVTYNAQFTEAPNTYSVVVNHLTVDGVVIMAPYTAELTEEKLYTYNAPAVEGKTPSHQYVNYHYQGEKILINIYYSEVSVWDGVSVSAEFVGEGTEENPYLISSGADLALLRERVNAGEKFEGKYFKMTNSIDFNNNNLIVIGKEVPNSSSWANLPTKGFAGIFDGNNCALLNVSTMEAPLSSSDELNGLFKTIFEGGKVANLSVYGMISQNLRGTGVIAGRNFGTIENCTNYVTIAPAEGTTTSQNHRYTGSIASINYGDIISCTNYGAITGEQYASGIVARSDKGNIIDCTNYATITGKGFKPAGICGETKGGTVSGCVNYGDVSGSQYAAGIVALNAATLSNCINYGNVTQTGSETAGGIAGGSTGAISNCTNYGNVTGVNKQVGGIVGSASATVSGCKNYGNVATTGKYDNIGGVVGYASAAISDCVNYGTVTGLNDSYGGIVGYTKSTVSNCENNGAVTGRQWLGGIAGRSLSSITNCINNANVTATVDFVGGIVGASDGAERTISGCVNNGAIKGSNYIGGIDGRPYAGNLTVDNCENNGTVTATSSYAGGILGRTDVAKAVLTNCKSNGAVTAAYPGAYVGLDKASDTTGCTIDKSCTSTLENMFYIGYDSLTGYPGGGLTTEFENTDKVDIVSGGFYDADGSIKSYMANNVAIIKNMSFTEGEFSTLVTLSSGVKAGVIFGYSKTDAGESYYRVTFSDTKSALYVDKVVNGTVTNLSSQYVASPNTAGEYEFHIVIEDGKAYCYFWGERLWAVIDMELTGTGVGIYAEHMGSEFRSYSVTSGVKHTTADTLIIGHSYMDFWSSYKADLSKVAEDYNFGELLNIGNGGSRANHWLSLKDSVAAYGADRIIYMIGINDISGNRAPATIVAEIEELLNYLKGLNPDLEVILLAVNHCPSKTAKATEIAQTNDLMQAFCAENDWTYFADIEYAFCDDGTNPTASWFTSDGLHLAAKAYTDKIVPAIAAGADYFAQQKITRYTIKFVDEQGNVLFEQQLPYGEMPSFVGTLPTLPENTDYCTYSGAWDKEIKEVTGDVTYTYIITADYEEYTIRFVDEDGTLLYETVVEWGKTPLYNGTQPTKASTSEYVYQFAGWTPEIAEATKDTTYTATYTAIATPYDVIIYHLNLDGTKVADDYTAELTEEKLYSYTAPVIEGKQASHEYLNYRYEGKKVLITIYYSEVSVWDGTSVSESFVGEGTAENPYLISSGADLALIRQLVNGGDTLAGKYFKMTNSIDLNKVSLMIGDTTTSSSANPPAEAFCGILDGNNCALLNIKTKETQTGQYAGFFKVLGATGKVSNLSFYGAYNQTIKMNGVIAGINVGIIENCTNYVSITPEDDSANVSGKDLYRYTGGIVSVNNGSIISCVNYGYIHGEQYASGIAGLQNATGKLENCINYATINGNGFKAAGICGETKGGTVTGCVNYGDVSGSQYVAGIVAYNVATLSDCVNYGNITQTGSQTAGGISGYSKGAISNCDNYGNVTGVNTQVGGIVGNAAAAVSNCNNYGDVKTTGNYNNVGGIAGQASAKITNCVNHGNVRGYNCVGGIVGNTTVAISDCVNHGNVNGGQWIGGIAGVAKVNMSNCTNNGNVTGTADFVGGIVGASGNTDNSTLVTRTISGCVNNGAVKGVGYVGGIDGRPYKGTVTYDSCINNGTVTATNTGAERGSAGGITGRSDTVKATLINCQSKGEIIAKSAGAYVGLHNASDTTGYVIYDSCSTTLTGNAIGYDKTLTAGVPLEGFAYTKTE